MRTLMRTLFFELYLCWRYPSDTKTNPSPKGNDNWRAKKVIDINSPSAADANNMDITIQIIQEIAYEVI